jgi:hypothetical protein
MNGSVNLSQLYERVILYEQRIYTSGKDWLPKVETSHLVRLNTKEMPVTNNKSIHRKLVSLQNSIDRVRCETDYS